MLRLSRFSQGAKSNDIARVLVHYLHGGVYSIYEQGQLSMPTVSHVLCFDACLFYVSVDVSALRVVVVLKGT